MPEVLLPDTSNPGPWHHYSASGKLVDQNGLVLLQFTKHASPLAIMLVKKAPLLMVRLQKLLEAAEVLDELSEQLVPELEAQIAATRNLLKLLAK